MSGTGTSTAKNGTNVNVKNQIKRKTTLSFSQDMILGQYGENLNENKVQAISMRMMDCQILFVVIAADSASMYMI